MKIIPKTMPKGYTVFWGILTLAYTVWMVVFMRRIVLVQYETAAERTIDGILHADVTGMIGAHWLYPVWVVLSCAAMALFPVYMKKMLFGKPSKAQTIFCLVSLLFGCLFITWYTFLKDPHAYTASMIGLDYPWQFRMWGVFASISLFVNTMYLYRKYQFYSPTGLVAGAIGCAAIFVTVNIPSAGENLVPTLRCIAHWSGALIFAFGCAAPLVLFLFNGLRQKDKKLTVLFFVFAAILAAMLILLVTVGKDGVIESLPMWATYLLLLLLNFTPWFTKKTPVQEKQPATIA